MLLIVHKRGHDTSARGKEVRTERTGKMKHSPKIQILVRLGRETEAFLFLSLGKLQDGGAINTDE